MTFAQQVLRSLIAAALFTTSVNSFAWTDTPLIVGESYLNSCDGLLTAVQEENIEQFFLDQAKTPEQALQLLSDYGIIFSKEFKLALIKALGARDVVLPFKMGPNARFVDQLLAIARGSDEELTKLTNEILEHVEVLSAENPGNELAAKVSMLAVKRLKSILLTQKSDSVVLTVFRDVVRITLLKTARSFTDEKHAKLWENSPVTSFFVAAFGGLFATALTIPYLTNSLSPDIDAVWPFFFGAGAAIYLGLSSFYWRDLAKSKTGAKQIREIQTGSGFDFQATRASVAGPNVTAPLFLDYTESLHKLLVVSLAACTTTNQICKLSPVQVAYAGHLDLLEVEMAAKELKALLEDQPAFSGLSAIAEAAENVRQNPANFRAQSELNKTLKEAMNCDSAARIRTRLAGIQKQLEEAQAALNRMVGGMFNFPEAQQSPELFNKNQLILYRLKSDLASMRATVDHDAVLNNIIDHKPALENLANTFPSAEDSEAIWRDYAENVLLVIAQFLGTSPSNANDANGGGE